MEAFKFYEILVYLNALKKIWIINVPEVLNVQMNEIKKKSNYVFAEFFQKVKTLNFVERKCDFFSQGVNY